MKQKRQIYQVLASALCLILLLSCQKEELQIASPEGNIKTRVSTGLTTKSSLPSEEELTRTIVMDEDSLLLQEFVSDNLSQPFIDGCPDTKGTVVTTDNISTNYSTFGIECFLDNYDEIDCEPHNMPVLTGDDQYIAGGLVSFNSTDSKWNLVDGSGNSYNWLWEMEHIFWSYAPKTHSGTYSYGSTGSRKTMTITGYTSPTAAADQKDLLVAYNEQSYDKTHKTETLDIKFRHALADIFFDVSGVEDGTVTKIEIIGAYSKGNCTVAGADLSNTDVTKAFTWASQSTTATFTMTSTSDHFFLIPQTLPTGAKVRITLDGTTTKEVAFTATWQPGKYYKYKLKYEGSYFFSLSPESSSSTPVTATTVSYESKTGDNSHDIQIYSTKNSTFSNWHIKSYQVGSEEEVNLTEGTTTFTAGGLTVSEVTSGSTSKLTVKANKWEKKSVGDNDYWTNKDSRKTDLLWSPASWVNNGVIDLSKFDFASDSPSSVMTTANCYIIRHAGTYKFPLVYGNGIEDGVVITAAYAPTTMASGGTSARFLATFQNHKDSNITSAFIENNTGCTASTTTYPPYVVWSDNSGVITNVSIVGDSQTLGSYTKDNVRYVQFTIPQDKICQNNALIAVRDASGNIMWSWHIWTTNDPSLLSSPIHVTNNSDIGYDFFPLNCLGWADAGKYIPREDVTITLEQDDSDKDAITITVKQPKTLSDDHSTGVHYQWGRKDPMPTKATGYPKKSGSQVTLGTAIKKPDTFIYYNSLTITNWCSSTYYNLWTGKKCSAGGFDQDNNTMIKTIYDPSPVGYKLPASSAFSGFSKTGDNLKEVSTTENFNIKGSYSNGYYFYVCKAASVTTDTPTIFFPTAGIISSGDGVYKRGWEYDGNFWSAFPGQDSGTYQTKSRYGSYLSISYTTGGSKQSVMPYNSANLALGASVRPVKWK